jgi:hypothetical protein
MTSAPDSTPGLPFVKHKHYRQYHTEKPSYIIPLELLLEIKHGEEGEDYERDHLLNDLQLRRRKVIGTNAIRRNLKAVLKESNSPAYGHYFPERNLTVLQMSVPRESHKNVGDSQ